jgi:hypothetical protein
MPNGKMPLLLTIMTGALFLAGVLVVQPYSADWPGKAYAKPAQRYIRAALQEDSTRLVRLSASDVAITWALRAARTHRSSLALWKGSTQALTGVHGGDTTEVFLYPAGETCHDAPIIFRFIGSGANAKVVSASSSCFP